VIFASDNWAGAHPKIAAGLSAHASGFEPAYGNGSLDAKVQQKFSEIFEREVAVFFVGTGTAANSLSLVSANKPGGLSFCHRESHIMDDECGAPEYFMGGSRLFAVDGELGRAEACAMMIRIANDTALAERVAAYAQQRLDLTLLSEALDAACGQRAPVTLEALFCRAVRSARSG